MIEALFLLFLIVACWFETNRIRESVISRYQRICKETNMQLLDQTVALFSFSIKRDGRGLFRVVRSYQFEFSENGTDRSIGHVDLIGRRIVSVRTEGPDGETVYYH